MTSNKITVTLALLVLALGSVAIGRELRARGAAFTPPVEERRKGNPAAQIKLVEYLDYQCGACAYATLYIKGYIQKHPEQIHLEANFFPLESHPHSQVSAAYVYCAQQQGKFWQFHDTLLERQQIWSPLGDPKPYFGATGRELGLDVARLDACAAKPETAQKILEIRKAGEARGVTSTPTFFVNGKMAVGINALIREMDVIFPNDKQKSQAPSPAPSTQPS